jgi:hypothetical protein
LFRELPVGGGGEKRKRNKEEIMAAGSGWSHGESLAP